MSTFRGTKIRRKDNASLRKDALIKSIKDDINKEYAKYHSFKDEKRARAKYKKALDDYYKELKVMGRKSGVGIVIDNKKNSIVSRLRPGMLPQKVEILGPPKNVKVYDLTTKAGARWFADRAERTETKFKTHTDAYIQRYQQRKSRIQMNKQLKLKKEKMPTTSVSRSVVAGGIKVDYVFAYQQLKEDFLENVIANIKAVMARNMNMLSKVNERGKPIGILNKYKISLSTTSNPFTDDRSFQTSKYTMRDAHKVWEEIVDRIERSFARYDEGDAELDFSNIGVSFIVKPHGQILGSGGHKTIQQANKAFFIIDTPAVFNCFWRCIATHHLLVKKPIDELERLLVKNSDMKEFNELINQNGKGIKSRNRDILSSVRATDEATIQRYVNKNNKLNSGYKCIIHIYDNVFKKIKTIRPENDDDSFSPNYVFHIQYINHHFIPLMKWYEFDDERKAVLKNYLSMKKFKADAVEVEEENTLIERNIYDREIEDKDAFRKYLKEEMRVKNEETDEWCKAGYDYDDLKKKDITKYERWFKKAHPECCIQNFEPQNLRIGAYDLEATPNGTDDDCFVAYRLSFAYNVLSEYSREVAKIKLVTFGGKECVRKWFEWLYENRWELTAYTLYAHNGGKFDVMLLLGDYLLKNSSKWIIENEKLIVLNGAYLSFMLASKEGDNESSVQNTPYTILSKNMKEEDGICSFITFRDSFKMLPMGLKKLCNEFDVEHKKISEVVNFKEVNIKNCFGGRITSARPFADEKFKIELCNYVYCNYDVLGLLEVLNKFSDAVYKDTNINITDCVTGASLSKKHYFQSYYDYKNTPVYNLNNETDEFCRNSYFGGRCEAFYIGEWLKALYYFDFTSLYPDVGRMLLPYGKPYKRSAEDVARFNEKYKHFLKTGLDRGNRKDDKNVRKEFLGAFPLSGICKVRVKTIDIKAIPLHALKNEGRLTFPIFADWTELHIWGREILYGIELGIYEYEFLEILTFGLYDNGHQSYCRDGGNAPHLTRDNFWSQDGILKDFFNDAVDKKAEAKRNGQPALAQTYKIIANSGYGFWGLNANGDGEGRDGLTICAHDDTYFWELLEKECVSNIGHIGDYILVRKKEKMCVADFNVAIASAICSEARMKLYRFIKSVRDLGGNILYMDTDSCITDLKLNDYPEMMKEFCWDGNGDDLGSMKNECLEKVEGYYREKVMKENDLDIVNDKKKIKELMKPLVKAEKDKDDGELSFDKGIIAGCKQYSLMKTLIDGGVISAGACKGCKRKLSYAEFQHLLYGTDIENQRAIEKKILAENPKFKQPDGFRLYEKQEQFRSSLCDHMREGSYTEIKRIEINKAVRINYTKGILGEGGFVTPHIL